MFEQTFVDGGKTRKGWTVLVSFIAQMIVLAIAILIPMIYFDALPKSQLTSFLVAPPPPPPPPPPPAAFRAARRAASLAASSDRSPPPRLPLLLLLPPLRNR